MNLVVQKKLFLMTKVRELYTILAFRQGDEWLRGEHVTTGSGLLTFGRFLSPPVRVGSPRELMDFANFWVARHTLELLEELGQ